MIFGEEKKIKKIVVLESKDKWQYSKAGQWSGIGFCESKQIRFAFTEYAEIIQCYEHNTQSTGRNGSLQEEEMSIYTEQMIGKANALLVLSTKRVYT